MGDHRSRQIERLFRAPRVARGRRCASGGASQALFAGPGRRLAPPAGSRPWGTSSTTRSSGCRRRRPGRPLGEGAPPETVARARGARATRRSPRCSPTWAATIWTRSWTRSREADGGGRPAGGDPGVDPQGVAAALRRGSAEPRGPAHRRPAGGAARATSGWPRATSGRRSRPTAPRAASSGAVMARGHRPPAALPSARRPCPFPIGSTCRRGRRRRRRRPSATSWPRSAGCRGSTRALVTVSADVATTTHLSGWVNRRGVYATARAGRRLRAPRAPAAHPLEGVPGRPAPRAGDRGGVVLRPAVRPGPGPGALRSAAPADRHALRLLPAAGPGPPAPRHVLEGPLHPGRQPLRHQPRPRGRRAPVGADPGLGIEVPNLLAWEPTFAREVEWLLLEALRVIQDPERGEAVYLRLSTKAVDQALMQPALDRLGEEALRAAGAAGRVPPGGPLGGARATSPARTS